MIIEIQNTLVSMDIITEEFCCDLEACKGKCCVEGDAGAPVTLDEIMELENVLDVVWPDLSASAQAVIDKQGVAYSDQEGELVTSIVNGKDCVFTYYGPLSQPSSKEEGVDTTINSDDKGNPSSHFGEVPRSDEEGPRSLCCLCATEKAFRAGKTKWCKPISCALYPIRVKEFPNNVVALNYHRWDICKEGVIKGKELHLPVYKFLREPLIRRFGEDWYNELCTVADELKKQGLC